MDREEKLAIDGLKNKRKRVDNILTSKTYMRPKIFKKRV